MKNLVVLLLFTPFTLFSQRTVHEDIALSHVNEVEMMFTWPEVIKIVEGTGDQIIISGTASINRGENDDAFKIISDVEDGVLHINSTIENYKDLPKRILIKKGDQEFYFKTGSMKDKEVADFIKQYKGEYNWVNTGVIKDINLKIEIPKGQKLKITSKYGLIEMSPYEGTVVVNSKYGGVDLSVDAGESLSIEARTKYGEIYSNLDLKLDPQEFNRNAGKWMTVKGMMGSGSKSCFIESQYGNVYLRKN